uniref:TIA1 cytotoxic granule-associated RNA binding protein n=1 Tax=Nothobranchius kadleci TaxID=1051664 RepID=A0A1A8CGF6_NOTKA
MFFFFFFLILNASSFIWRIWVESTFTL